MSENFYPIRNGPSFFNLNVNMRTTITAHPTNQSHRTNPKKIRPKNPYWFLGTRSPDTDNRQEDKTSDITYKIFVFTHGHMAGKYALNLRSKGVCANSILLKNGYF